MERAPSNLSQPETFSLSTVKLFGNDNVLEQASSISTTPGLASSEATNVNIADAADIHPPPIPPLPVPTLPTSTTSSSTRKRSKSRSPKPSVRFSTRARSSSSHPSELLTPPLLNTEKLKLVDCKHKAAGCQEKVPEGTMVEKEHLAVCNFRPIPCLMNPSCSQLVPYHNFLLHHMQHFLHPTFASSLSTSVFFQREDFARNQRWHPRWMNCYNKDFFVMLSHKLTGMWYVWVWMLGSPAEAAGFSYEVEVSKGEIGKTGTYPVLSVRTTTDEIEKSEICLSLTDFQVKRFSQIKDNLVGCLEIDLMIYQTKTNKKSHYLL